MSIFSSLYSLVAFIVVIGVLVTIHEFGHFWVARKMGVKVLRFSVGFGKPIWSRMGSDGETEYAIGSIPLGGYVKMLDEREGKVDAHELDRAFNRKRVSQRFAIVFAGPLFNFLFAIFAYSLIYMAGVSGYKPIVGEVQAGSIAAQSGVEYRDIIISVNGIETPSWETVRFILLEESIGQESIELKLQKYQSGVETALLSISDLGLLKKEQMNPVSDLGLSVWRPDMPPIIDSVIEGGAAENAGIMAEDLILNINGQKVSNLQDWVSIVRSSPDRLLKLEVDRGGLVVELDLIPRSKSENDETYGFVGVMNRIVISSEISKEIQVVEQYNPLLAVIKAVDRTWRMSLVTLKVMGKLVTGEANLKNLSGPITIAKYAGITAQIGVEEFLGFLAIISISLGVLNLLPVPMLDGGHLFYYLIEIVKGSPVSESIELVGQKIGLVLLFGLMSLAMYNDLLRLVN
jgi:regulator of sigma E protease